MSFNQEMVSYLRTIELQGRKESDSLGDTSSWGIGWGRGEGKTLNNCSGTKKAANKTHGLTEFLKCSRRQVIPFKGKNEPLTNKHDTMSCVPIILNSCYTLTTNVTVLEKEFSVGNSSLNEIMEGEDSKEIRLVVLQERKTRKMSLPQFAWHQGRTTWIHQEGGHLPPKEKISSTSPCSFQSP